MDGYLALLSTLLQVYCGASYIDGVNRNT